MPKEKWSAKSREEEKALREAIRHIILEDYKVRGYIKPSSSFKSLAEWEDIVNTLLAYQSKNMGVRDEMLSPECYTI